MPLGDVCIGVVVVTGMVSGAVMAWRAWKGRDDEQQ